MTVLIAQHVGVRPGTAARSLLFAAVRPRRGKSLLLPIRWPETVRREDLLARHLASLPAGAVVTVPGLLAAVPGLRLQPSQAETLAATLRRLGWRAGKGNVLFSRPDCEAGADRPRGTHARGRVHPAVVAALPRITALLDAVPEGGSVTEVQIAEACGVGLVSHHRRAVGRQLRRMGWRPVSPRSHRLVRGGA